MPVSQTNSVTPRERAIRAEQERIRTLELAEQLELWRQGDPNVSAWQLHGASAALRIVGDNRGNVEGRAVPLSARMQRSEARTGLRQL